MTRCSALLTKPAVCQCELREGHRKPHRAHYGRPAVYRTLDIQIEWWESRPAATEGKPS